MTREEADRLSDIAAAFTAIDSYVSRGDLADGLVFDAVRIRLIEIGEAVKALPDELTDREPGLPRRDMGRMRDFLAHRYFDSTHSVIQHTVDHDLPLLAAAVLRLQADRGH